MTQHIYPLNVRWTGNVGEGTKSYHSYRRDHVIEAGAKPPVPCSSDPSFLGDPSRYNPEELLVASLSGCHMLWYLHLCAVNHVTVVEYSDAASGVMEETADGSGSFTRVVLRPVVKIREGGAVEMARELHAQAHRVCFIARSVNFPIDVLPEISVAAAPP